MSLDKGITLNAYIAHAGICSRRQAVERIKDGQVKVNGVTIVDPGHRVIQSDAVKVGSRLIKQESKVYILLNKPKNCTSTVSDEKGRRTVLDVVGNVCGARVYPVGRLDRETTGLLLLTNDGSFAQQLAHPRNTVQKVYHVALDKPLELQDELAIKKGVFLPDGKVVVDELYCIARTGRKVISVTLHSGRYRVIRRLFESLGYMVKHLDRVAYAGLSQNGLRSGAWRFLSKNEIKQVLGTN